LLLRNLKVERWKHGSSTDIPNKWGELIDRAKELEGWDNRAQYVRELIKRDLEKKGLLGKNGQIEENTVLVEG